MLRRVGPWDASVLENRMHTTGGPGDERAHTMRWDDADAQYDSSVNDVWMKGSPQGTSLRGIVIILICLVYTIFQRIGWGSGGIVHINDATGDMKGRML
jgi:hypothetical protein